MFRGHSPVFRSIARDERPSDVAREIISAAFSERSSSIQAVRNISRCSGAYFQFALKKGIPVTGEDSLSAAAQ